MEIFNKYGRSFTVNVDKTLNVLTYTAVYVKGSDFIILVNQDDKMIVDIGTAYQLSIRLKRGTDCPFQLSQIDNWAMESIPVDQQNVQDILNVLLPE